MALTAATSLLGITRQTTSRLVNYVSLATSLHGKIPLVSQNPVLEQRRNYAMRLELTEHGIIWKRPEYVPSWKPSKSGDLEALPKMDLSRPVVKVSAAKEAFEQADEVTKRLLSLEFSSHKESIKVQKLDTLRKIQRHKYDVGSFECIIALMTLKIRKLQEIVARSKKNTAQRVHLQEAIIRRKTLLKSLRQSDYKRFEWLIEELNIHYKPYPVKFHWITRKDSLRKLVQLHKDTIRQERLEAYRAKLDIQKEPYMKEKEEILAWINKTEKELGVADSEEVESKEVKS